MSTAPRLTIDLNALVENWRIMSAKSGNAEASAVVKADAYGLGIQPVAKALFDAGCKTFFTALIEEAAAVRQVANEARIFVLSGVLPETIDAAKQNSIIPVLSSQEQISIWADQGNRNPSVINIDTGMNRLGLSIEEADELSQQGDLLALINPAAVMSHLACADEPSDPKNAEQLDVFQAIANKFDGVPKCFANSAGVLMGPEYHFDLTRPGIALYGGEAVNDIPNPMNVVVTAEARILQVRSAKKGETVGYGAAHKLERDTKIAVCAAGYADGFHRSGSGAGVALRAANASGGTGAIGNYLAPILGRVSMDLIAFDVTDIPEQNLEHANWVELFGRSIAVDDAARNCGTIGYELLTSLGNRYQRNYLHPKTDEA